MSDSRMKFVVVFVCFFCVPLAFHDSAFAQRGRGKSSGQFDVTTILKRIDANGNGVLEPSEMSGRTKDFVRKNGIDPNRPQSIQSISKMLEAKGKAAKEAAKNGADAAAAERKVPGFGVDVELVGVPDFSPTGEERMSEEAMKHKFGDSILAQVERTMVRYDKDKNGMIDLVEQKRTRWTDPSADVSDTNNDSNLSRLELAYRYKNREDKTLKKTQNAKNRIASRKTSAKGTTATSKRYNRPNVQSRSNSRSTARTNSRNTATNTAKRGFNNGGDAYKRYAEGLIKNYDKDKDSRLSKKEMDEMRRPPKNADSNKDGYVDKAELIASVTSRSTGGASNETAAVSTGKTSISREVESKRRSPNKTFNKADSIFGGKDTNSDQQLQMSEFADSWSEETVKEFKEKDLNADGVITEKEWQGY